MAPRSVLALLLLVLAGCVAENEASAAPAIGFTQDEAADQLRVRSPTAGATWDRYAAERSDGGPGSVRMGHAGCNVATHDGCQNEPAEATGPSIQSVQAISLRAVEVRAGDFIEFCAQPGSTNVKVRISDSKANAVMGEFTFASVAPC